MLYFAYGSNMDPVQMATRCPETRTVGISYLTDHALYFPRLSTGRNCGVASVRPEAGKTTWGVVYELHKNDLSNLDTNEGFKQERSANHNDYNRVMVEIMIDEKPHDALIYLAVEQETPPLPSLDYLTHMRTGAQHHGLPDHYLEFLDALPHE